MAQAAMLPEVADSAELRGTVHDLLLRESESGASIDRSRVREAVDNIAPLLNHALAEQLITDVLADINGMGPLQELLSDDLITEVMVVGNRGVWVEREGGLLKTSLRLDDHEIERLIERVVAPLGLRVDRASPMVDARLGDGSRVNAVLPPLAIDGPCLTVRRFGTRVIGLEAMASPKVAHLLREAAKARQNIIVSGGTGAGKTTFLNTVAAFIGEHERVITIEDTAELRLPLAHVVRLEARPANSEGIGRVQLRDLVRNALRMRPDRIIVGEVRGSEALDMLQAMNTGHEGSMSTCHSNSPLDALRRIETMVLMSEVALPLEAVRQQIVASIDLIVQVARVTGGLRQVINVSEVVNGPGTDGPTVRLLATGDRVVAAPSRRRRNSETHSR